MLVQLLCVNGLMTTCTRKIPDFASMFSDNPRYTVKLDPAVPQLAFTDLQWRGHREQRKEALQQLAGITPTWLKREECNVTGADYCKYFKRPLIHFAQQIPPSVVYALPREDFETSDKSNAEQQPTHFTVGVQTDYRESEAQTDPYSPEYVIQPGTTPSELLQMAALTWGHGLPAGLAEVEMIERARAKRAWEASLPPLSDLSQLDKRRHMMEEMEAKEWAFREGEIEKLQEARLAVLNDLLRQRDEAQKDATNARLNQIYSKLQEDKKTKQNKRRTDYERSLRKLEAKRKNEERKLERFAIASHTYVPRIRRDIFPIRNINSKLLTSCYLDTYEGLQELELQLSASVLKPEVKKTKSKLIKDIMKPPDSRAVQLVKKYKALKEEQDMKKAVKASHFLLRKEKPIPHPPTPTVEERPEGEEEKELAVIFLQKLLRGRRIQYEMVKGKEEHRDLIQELRTVHALKREEQEQQKANKGHIMMLKKQRDKHGLKEASQAGVVGAELEQVFDTLSKELIHLQEERKVHAFTLLAERDRRLREAEESGRRQVEERKRIKEDEIFRQVVQVHQETVDLYLEDIILGSSEHIADQQTREEIHKRAKELNDIAYAIEESRDNLQSEEIVSELVYSFLIPEVKKIDVRRRVHQKQHRHLQAARSIIQGTPHPSELLSTPEASKCTCPGIKASSHVMEEMMSQVEQGNEAEQHEAQTEYKED
ncbi:cilia- and flagella-associated protein 91 isoform X2 [Archocentrus centrarchus]|uniref:cilia- and flagella-associated protein 91 isoform X2 n=1 Tax=Archocentrus centrarchus TaxID=63155 RepID=UPI0011EA3E5F|nr:cilia- and flagella-associated protein 91 isoform X2 [Archocentrus centrarchus]